MSLVKRPISRRLPKTWRLLMSTFQRALKVFKKENSIDSGNKSFAFSELKGIALACALLSQIKRNFLTDIPLVDVFSFRCLDMY